MYFLFKKTPSSGLYFVVYKFKVRYIHAQHYSETLDNICTSIYFKTTISHLEHSQSDRSTYGETMASSSDFTYDDSVAEDELTVVQETGRRRYEYVHHP